jgi:hypothetical protein
MRRTFSALLMTATLAAPTVAPANVLAGEPRANANITVRIYDPYRRDHHVWDQREERAYRGYLAERHRSYVAYERQRLAQRRAYWRWRHERAERFEQGRR